MPRLNGVAVLAAALLLFTGRSDAAAPKAGDVESKTHPGIFYRLSKSFDGAITKDDFEGEKPDPKIWSIRQTPDLKVYLGSGTLHIKGVWPEDPRNTGGMIGAFSLYPGDIWHVYCVPPPRK